MEVTILKQDNFGRGITKIEDKLVFVDKALPNEKCKIKITNIKKNYEEAILEEVIKPSSFRIKPLCPYYDKCGGCHIMHQEYKEQLKFKEEKVKELILRFTKLESINIFPIIFNNEFNYRNKVIFHGESKKLGFYHEKTHDIIDINSCLLLDNKINNIYQKIKSSIKNNEEIKSILIRNYNSNLLVAIDGNLSIDNIINLDIDTLYYNNNLIKGNGYILEDIHGLKFKVFPQSFFQVNYNMMIKLYDLVINFYKDKKYKKVLDLYCGTGTIGMLISKYCDNVVGVEVEKSSIESAMDCMKLNNIDNISFYHGKVEDYIDKFNDIDSIIIDPPRSGLDNYTKENILKILPSTIVYISCDPVTLARDLVTFLDDYNIVEVHPVDMFPNTYHVETVCIMKKL